MALMPKLPGSLLSKKSSLNWLKLITAKLSNIVATYPLKIAELCLNTIVLPLEENRIEDRVSLETDKNQVLSQLTTARHYCLPKPCLSVI